MSEKKNKQIVINDCFEALILDSEEVLKTFVKK